MSSLFLCRGQETSSSVHFFKRRSCSLSCSARPRPFPPPRVKGLLFPPDERAAFSPALYVTRAPTERSPPFTSSRPSEPPPRALRNSSFFYTRFFSCATPFRPFFSFASTELTCSKTFPQEKVRGAFLETGRSSRMRFPSRMGSA